jgi:hypothetical protein
VGFVLIVQVSAGWTRSLSSKSEEGKVTVLSSVSAQNWKTSHFQK